MGSDFYLEYLNQKSVVRSYGCNVIVFLSLFSIFINRLFSRSVREYVHDYHLRLLTWPHGCGSGGSDVPCSAARRHVVIGCY